MRLATIALLFVGPAMSQIPALSQDLASGSIAIQGSTVTPRQYVDSWYGQVYVYVGGAIPAGTQLKALQFLFDTNYVDNSGYITPLLFEFQPDEAFTVYTVTGIGKGFPASYRSTRQTIPFEIVEGIKVPPTGNFTFGFVNSLVDANGVPTATSLGTVDMDSPGDGGHGVGGLRTSNDWVSSNSFSTPPVVTLGTTFAMPGANADYVFFTPYRTYSAIAIGTATPQSASQP